MSVTRLYDVWVPESSNNTLVQIVNGVAAPKISNAGFAVSVCVDGNGIVWCFDENGSVRPFKNRVAQTAIALESGLWEGCADKENNIWVTNRSQNTVRKIVNGVAQTAISVPADPRGICCDKDNNIWVACRTANSVTKIVNGVAQTAISVPGYCRAICCNQDNEIYALGTSGNVYKIVNNTIADTYITPAGFAICCDKDNNLWISTTAGTVRKITNGIVGSAISTGGNSLGISVDGNNAVWVCSSSTNSVHKIVNETIVLTVANIIAPNGYGDMTGMKWEMFFGKRNHQAMTGGI